MKSLTKLLSALALVFAHTVVNGQTNDSHLIHGKWLMEKGGQFCELHEYRPDGTRTVHSGDEVIQSTYKLTGTPGSMWFLLEVKKLSDNGEKDCFGIAEDDSGKTATGHIFFAKDLQLLGICVEKTVSYETCFGPFYRVK